MYFVAFVIAFGKMCFPVGSPGLIIWALVTSRDAINPIKVRARIVFSQVAYGLRLSRFRYPRVRQSRN
jgi:hypothetical protein